MYSTHLNTKYLAGGEMEVFDQYRIISTYLMLIFDICSCNTVSTVLTHALLFHGKTFCCVSKTRVSVIQKRMVFFTVEIAYRKNVSPGTVSPRISQ